MKKGGLIVSLLGVVLVVVGSVLLLTSGPKKSNKELFTDAVQKSLGLFVNSNNDEGKSTIESTISDIKEKISNNIYKLTIDASLTQDEASYGNGEAVLYYGKNQAYFKVNANSNDKVFNLQGMLKDDKFYFEFKDVLEKAYYIDKVSEMFNVMGNNSNNTKLMEKVVNYLLDSFKDAIKEEDVNIESSDLTINGKSYSTKKYSYTFSGNTLYNIVVNFVNKVKNDNEIVNELNKAIEQYGDILNEAGSIKITKEDLNQLLDQIPEMAKELKNIGNLLTYTVHMYKDEPISRQLSVMIPSEQGNVPIILADYKGEGYYKIAVSTMGIEMYKLEAKETSANYYDLSLSMMDKEIVKGYIKIDNGNYEIKIQPLSNAFKYNNSSNVIIHGNDWDDDDDDYDWDDDDNDYDWDDDDDDYDWDDDDEEADFENYILININKDNTGSIKFVSEYSSVDLTYKLEEVNEIPEMDIANSVSIDDMTENDKELLESFIGMFDVVGLNKNAKAYDVHSNIGYREGLEM